MSKHDQQHDQQRNKNHSTQKRSCRRLRSAANLARHKRQSPTHSTVITTQPRGMSQCERRCSGGAQEPVAVILRDPSERAPHLPERRLSKRPYLSFETLQRYRCAPGQLAPGSIGTLGCGTASQVVAGCLAGGRLCGLAIRPPQAFFFRARAGVRRLNHAKCPFLLLNLEPSTGACGPTLHQSTIRRMVVWAVLSSQRASARVEWVLSPRTTMILDLKYDLKIYDC